MSEQVKPIPDGNRLMHAEICSDGATLMPTEAQLELGGRVPKSRRESTVTIHPYLPVVSSRQPPCSGCHAGRLLASEPGRRGGCSVRGKLFTSHAG